MRQKTKNNLRITLLILFLTILIGISIFFIVRQSIFSVEGIGVYQIVGSGTYETGDLYVEQRTVAINTGINIFKFTETSVVDMSTMGLVYYTGAPDYSRYVILQLDVYKDNTKISTLSSLVTCGDIKMSSPGCKYPNQMYQITNTSYSFYDDIGTRIDLGMQIEKNEFPGGQWYNRYYLTLSNESLEFDILTTQKNLIQGQPIVISVKITNKLKSAMFGKSKLILSLPSFFGATKEIMQDVVINPGENIYNFTADTKEITGDFMSKFFIELFMNGSNFEKLNYNGKKLTNSDLVFVGKFVSDDKIILINPKPLYLEKSGEVCLVGYVLSSNKEYCVRDDIKDLSCVILGCPQIANHIYECTSAGICAETVFTTVYVEKKCINNTDCPQNISKTTCDIESGLCIKTETYKETIKCVNNTQCPTDAICNVENGICESFINIYKEIGKCERDDQCPQTTACDINSGVCIKSQIFSELIQCEKSEDCLIPCPGKMGICNENKRCEYRGECGIINIGCKELGCPQDYTCDESKNVCNKETIIAQEKFKFPSYLWFVFGGIFVFIILIFFIFKFKKKKR